MVEHKDGPVDAVNKPATSKEYAEVLTQQIKLKQIEKEFSSATEAAAEAVDLAVAAMKAAQEAQRLSPDLFARIENEKANSTNSRGIVSTIITKKRSNEVMFTIIITT